MKVAIIPILILVIISIDAHSQSVMPEVVASGGESFIGGNSQLLWTLGETVVETFNSADYFLTQGFQQPNFIVVAMDKQSGSSYQIAVFPNPVGDDLQLNTINQTGQKERLRIQLMDISGKVVFSDKIGDTAGIYMLNMKSYAAGTYVLNIIGGKGGLIESYKIQKVKY